MDAGQRAPGECVAGRQGRPRFWDSLGLVAASHYSDWAQGRIHEGKRLTGPSGGAQVQASRGPFPGEPATQDTLSSFSSKS